MQQRVDQIVIGILAKLADTDPSAICRDTSLAELGIESIKLVEAIFLFEDALDISVPPGAFGKGGTIETTRVGALIDSLSGLVREQA